MINILLDLSIYYYHLLVWVYWRILANIDFGSKSGPWGTLRILRMIFLIVSGFSGVYSLIWLDLKMIMTLSSSNQSTGRQRCALIMKINQYHGYYIGPLFHGNCSIFFPLTGIDIKFVAHLPYLFVKLLPKTSFMDLKNVSPTVVAHCTTLFLISKLTS